MTAPVDTTFSSGTTITSDWLNGVNDHVNDQNSTAHDATKITFTPTDESQTTVAARLQAIGKSNQYAVGMLPQNTDDYASLGSNLLPAFSAITKVNFTGAGVHTAGTVGTLTASITGETFSYYIVELSVTTTTTGKIGITVSGTDIFGDQPNGVTFSSVTPLLDGIENNRILDATTYRFAFNTSGSSFTNLVVTTDTTWAGTISDVKLYKPTSRKIAIGGLPSGSNGQYNPVGLKVGSYERNDLALGDKMSLGAFLYDGLTPTPSGNVAVGSKSQAANLHGDENTSVGTFALMQNEGSDNTAFGYSALKLNTKGQENAAFGYKCLILNGIGYRNSGFGFWAGAQNPDGIHNSYFGWYAGRNHLGGDYSTCIGSQAGQAWTTSASNTFVGALSGYGAGTGVLTTSQNVAVGAEAMTWGNTSVAIGHLARTGASGSSQDGCVAVGKSATASATRSMAVGISATASGSDSIAIGRSATASGSRNIGIGETCVATGSQQVTVVGGLAEGLADYTTAIGCQAGRNFNGNYNTFLGRAAGLQTVTYLNCTLLGANTTVTGSNQVQLGDSATTTYAYGAVQNRSDARDKAEVRDTVLGLSFIEQLRPVDFKYDFREDYGWGEKDGSKIRNRYHHGLIAQEVKEVIDSLGVDFGGYQDHSINGGQDVLSIGYSELIGPLIRAVQELSAEVKQLQQQIG
jgi:hypothetical protein